MLSTRFTGGKNFLTANLGPDGAAPVVKPQADARSHRPDTDAQGRILPNAIAKTKCCWSHGRCCLERLKPDAITRMRAEYDEAPGMKDKRKILGTSHRNGLCWGGRSALYHIFGASIDMQQHAIKEEEAVIPIPHGLTNITPANFNQARFNEVSDHIKLWSRLKPERTSRRATGVDEGCGLRGLHTKFVKDETAAHEKTAAAAAVMSAAATSGATGTGAGAAAAAAAAAGAGAIPALTTTATAAPPGNVVPPISISLPGAAPTPFKPIAWSTFHSYAWRMMFAEGTDVFLPAKLGHNVCPKCKDLFFLSDSGRKIDVWLGKNSEFSMTALPGEEPKDLRKFERLEQRHDDTIATEPIHERMFAPAAHTRLHVCSCR